MDHLQGSHCLPSSTSVCLALLTSSRKLSDSSCQGFRQSRKDDLESICFILAEVYSGCDSLPWYKKSIREADEPPPSTDSIYSGGWSTPSNLSPLSDGDEQDSGKCSSGSTCSYFAHHRAQHAPVRPPVRTFSSDLEHREPIRTSQTTCVATRSRCPPSVSSMYRLQLLYGFSAGR